MRCREAARPALSELERYLFISNVDSNWNTWDREKTVLVFFFLSPFMSLPGPPSELLLFSVLSPLDELLSCLSSSSVISISSSSMSMSLSLSLSSPRSGLRMGSLALMVCVTAWSRVSLLGVLVWAGTGVDMDGALGDVNGPDGLSPAHNPVLLPPKRGDVDEDVELVKGPDGGMGMDSPWLVNVGAKSTKEVGIKCFCLLDTSNTNIMKSLKVYKFERVTSI